MQLFYQCQFKQLYTPNYSAAKTILQNIDDLLKENDLSNLQPKKIPGEPNVGDSHLIFMRYGNFLNRGNAVTFKNPSGERQERKIQDSRRLPFPEFVWKLNSRALDGDEKFFPETPLHWKIPGTDQTIILNDGQYSSWTQLFKPSKILPHIKQKNSSVNKFMSIFNDHLTNTFFSTKYCSETFSLKQELIQALQSEFKQYLERRDSSKEAEKIVKHLDRLHLQLEKLLEVEKIIPALKSLDQSSLPDMQQKNESIEMLVDTFRKYNSIIIENKPSSNKLLPGGISFNEKLDEVEQSLNLLISQLSKLLLEGKS